MAVTSCSCCLQHKASRKHNLKLKLDEFLHPTSPDEQGLFGLGLRDVHLTSSIMLQDYKQLFACLRATRGQESIVLQTVEIAGSKRQSGRKHRESNERHQLWCRGAPGKSRRLSAGKYGCLANPRCRGLDKIRAGLRRTHRFTVNVCRKPLL